MKITIKNIIKENKDIDPKQRYINGIVNRLRTPYFYKLMSFDVPKELWNEILSKLFNQILTYRSRSRSRSIYDSNNNEIYFEDSNGDWVKREYDSNNNKIYFENSYGDWVKWEYDENNNEIYYENSDGVIIVNRPRNTINENIDSKQRYINGIVNRLRTPYFINLGLYDVPRELWNDIFSNLFKQIVTYRSRSIYDSNNNQIYYENSDGHWGKWEYGENNNVIYRENSDGYWEKSEYDSNNNKIYYENSDGHWEKSEYDEYNNEIYYENSVGYWVKREYDENNNNIYSENSYGYWEKREYDENNNVIYIEKSNGYWYKREFDSNNNVIYREDSDGIIIDYRPKNPINENIDPKQKYLSLVVDNMVKQSVNNQFPFDSGVYTFNEYCKKVYGLTDDEIDYVFRKYRFLMGWDEYDRSLPYLKKLI